MSDEMDDLDERETAASGLPAPTMEEAQHELGLMKNLLDTHGCATTRDLIGGASLVVDIAHRDAHNPLPEEVREKTLKLLEEVLKDTYIQIGEVYESITDPLNKIHFLSRMNTIFFTAARHFSANAVLVIQEKNRQEAEDQTQAVEVPKVETDMLTPEQKQLLKLSVSNNLVN